MGVGGWGFLGLGCQKIRGSTKSIVIDHVRWVMIGATRPPVERRCSPVTTPMTALSFTDDELMGDESIADLHDRFVNADQIHQRYSPAQLEVDRMGHHGFFRARHQDLWDELVLPYLAS